MKHIYDIASYCHSQGIENVILCPGSRSAPLAIAFMRYPSIKTYVIPDERSAGFIGLGIAQISKKPVGLVCTSGSAALNFYPAITEAYYRNIPLLALTADRPPEWIDQLDGQTIRQKEVFRNHIQASLEFPLLRDTHDLKTAENTLKIAFRHLEDGPVHINIPFEEPFYPDPTAKITFSEFEKLTFPSESTLNKDDLKELQIAASKYKHPIIVVGQQYLEYQIREALQGLNVPIITDVISNYRGLPNSIEHQDLFLAKETPPVDLVITFGLSVISKNLKLFLRNQTNVDHWHIGKEPAADTFRCLKKVIPNSPFEFFSHIKLNNVEKGTWDNIDQDYHKFTKQHLSEMEYGEFNSIFSILNIIPQNSHLHLANSMPVRYANFCSTKDLDITVHSNRGTSGIDGILSTAVGSAIADPEHIHTLFIGDVSLFYDRNGLWHSYVPSNLRIVLLNNHGGGIFRMIPGPAMQPELEEYFVTKQTLKADLLAQEHGLIYLHSENKETLAEHLDDFFAPSSRAKLLEITTDGNKDAALFKNFKASC